MNMQVYCNDLYDLNETNTELFNEHKQWYKDFKAMSVGDLIDKQQDMLDSYRKAVDNSTMEITDLKHELEVANKSLQIWEEVSTLQLKAIDDLKKLVSHES